MNRLSTGVVLFLFLLAGALLFWVVPRLRGAEPQRFMMRPLPLGDHEYAVAIAVDENAGADKVIVTIFYKVRMVPGIEGGLVLSRTSVIDAMPVLTMTDSVPAGEPDIWRVDVTLVKKLGERTQFNAEELHQAAKEMEK